MRFLQSTFSTSLQNWFSSWIARLASFTFRVMVCSLPTSESFTSCWVIVEPPWEMPPASELARTARSTDFALTPSWL